INVFLKHLITLDRPVEQIVMYCKRLSDDDFFTFGLSKAAEQAYNSNKTSLGLQIVLKMVEEGTKPRSHFFWPGLAVARNNKDTEEIFRILNIMNQVGCPPNYETFVFYILPAFDLQNPEAVVRKLRETVGQNTANIMNPVLSILLSDNRLMEAVDLVRVFPCPVYAAIIPKLAGLTKKTSDYHLLFQILQDVKDSPNQRFLTHEKPDWNGVFLIESIRINNRIEDLEELLNQMASKNILITQNTVDQIRNILNNELQPNINELLERLVTTDEGQLPNQAEGFLPHPNDMNLDELEAHFIELKSKNMNTRGILRKLLLLHCRLKNYERAVELKKITEDEGHEMTSSVYSSLIELFCHYKKLDKAVECKNWIDVNDSNFMIDDYKIINLARMYTQNGRIDDAIVLLRSTHQKLNVSNRKLAGVQSNVRLLLSDISSTGDIENTQRLYDTIVVECGYASPNSSTLASIINACIVKGNLELAVAKLEEFAKEHKVTPIVNNILVQLILQEDTDGIRRVMDASSAIHGEVNILYNLAFAFIDAGKVNQAKKIFETRGLRANMDRLEYKCDVYLRRNQVTYLENLVKVTRDLFGLNRDVMYFYLIRAYCKIGDVNKALGVWLTMQEENVIASSKTLRYLADFLKSKNHPVPFQIPEQGISPGSTQQSQSGELSTFRESLASNNLDKALDDKRMLEANGQTLNLFSFNKLIKELLDAHRINDAIMITKEMFSQQQFPLQRTIRRLLSVLGQNGDLGTLEELKSYVTPVFLNNVDFDSAIGTALVINHRHLEYLSTLEEDLENLPSSSSSSEALAKFPYRCLFVMMERHPQDTTERVTALAETYAKNHNYYDPMNMVWVHHFISKDFNAAEKILKDYPKLMHNLKYMWI
ncbi:LRPPRC (predicted), partial [Pycnogonum litorale]